MRDKIYSERRRKIHSFMKRFLNNSFLSQWFNPKQKTFSTHTDPLTGIYNQFAMNSYIKELSPQSDFGYAIILINLDNFKNIQNTYGVKAGEQTLMKTAALLTSHIRETDLVGKYGEHEFMIILSNIDLDNANKVANRCLHLLQNASIHFNAQAIALQASCGVSASHEDLVSDRVLQYADRALFLAKAGGSNQQRDERAIFS